MFRTRGGINATLYPRLETVTVFDLRHSDIVHLMGIRAVVEANPVTYHGRLGVYACVPAVILNRAEVAELAAADPAGVGRLIGAAPQTPHTLTLRGSRHSYWVRERRVAPKVVAL